MLLLQLPFSLLDIAFNLCACKQTTQPPDSLLQVLSQVLVPPLVQEYTMVRDEWLKQKLWKEEPFIEVLNPGCDEAMTAKTVKALDHFLEM